MGVIGSGGMFVNYKDLLNNLGFDGDPFAKNNADEEERLEEYFISPPFFDAIYGDVTDTKSSIVFAPRGAGKTALKRMVEISSKNDPILCVTYNNFDVYGRKLEDIDLTYHLKNIIRLILVAVITSIKNDGVLNLGKDEKHFLCLFVKEYLSNIEQLELKNSIEAVKNFSDKAKEWWNTFLGPIGLIANALLVKIGMDKVDLDKFDIEGGKLGRLDYQLQILKSIANKLGYNKIFVLIDKVDENSLTQNASESYQFISSILNNLQTLEMPGIVFKIFLWDLVKQFYHYKARPDRITYETLEWDHNKLKEMLFERLKAYSNKKVKSFSELCEDTINKSIDIDNLIIMFSQGSPRNIVRICKKIIAHQSEYDINATKIGKEAITQGIQVFAEEWTNQNNIPNTVINELTKTKRIDFTVKYIYSDIFKITQQAGISKIKVWQDSGVVTKIGTIQESKGSRPSNFYYVSSILLAKNIFSNIDVFEFIKRKVRTCSECKTILVRDWDLRPDNVCHSCQKRISL